MELEYAAQPNPNGLAEAFIIGEEFLAGSSACLILGDNLFFGYSMSEKLKNSVAEIDKGGALIFGYQVADPTQYGVVE
ncbi:MAG: sugar phosphate nucleotidyltransferase, partial [Bacteroidota bacterium]